MGYFVGVKTVILRHIEIASIISILLHFHPWAILSVNHKKGLPSGSPFLEPLSAGRTGARAKRGLQFAFAARRSESSLMGRRVSESSRSEILGKRKIYTFVLTILSFNYTISVALGGLRANSYPPSCKDGVTYIRAWAIVKQESYPAAIPKK